MEELIIPNDATIRLLDVTGATNLKRQSLDEIINDLHHQVTNSPRAGDFSYHMGHANPDVPIIELSTESLTKLRKLKNGYGWTVVPDPDL